MLYVIQSTELLEFVHIDLSAQSQTVRSTALLIAD